MRHVIRSLVWGRLTARKAVDGQALRLGADKARCTTVGKKQERQHLLEVLCFLQVQRAELEIKAQDACPGFGTYDVARRLQCVDGRVAPHESDHGAINRRVQSEVIHDIDIQPRRIQTRTAGDNHVRDALPLGQAEGKLVERAGGQARRKLLKDAHAPGCIGKISDHVEVLRIAPVELAVPDRFQERVAMLDGRHAHHALEQVALRAFGKHALGKRDECVMHIMPGDCSGNALDMGGGHLSLSLGRPK